MNFEPISKMKNFYKFIALLLIMAGCGKSTDPIKPDPNPPKPTELELSNGILLKWVSLTLDLVKNTRDNSPTYTSRSMGYIGLTMYESVAQGSIVYQSVANQLNNAPSLPTIEKNLAYDWELSFNAAQAVILKALYPHATIDYQTKIDSLQSITYHNKIANGLDQGTAVRSQAFGEALAKAIYEWSTTDGGKDGYDRTFDDQYQLPVGPAFWVPPTGGQSPVLLPMHPNWGKNRTFLKANEQLEVPQMIPYSKVTGSDYFNQMQAVYDANRSLTQAQKEAALWWGDDPTSSVSPPGHSIYIATKLIKEQNLKLFDAAATLAKTGMAVADAFINCWKCKYFYHAERPTAYIKRNINGAFVQFWPEPPFPGFTSGHSTQGMAAATAITSIIPDNTPFVDDLHLGRNKDEFRNVEFKARSFEKITDYALECGISRIYGGIHTPQDNEMGLKEGKLIGENVNALVWKKL